MLSPHLPDPESALPLRTYSDLGEEVSTEVWTQKLPLLENFN